MGLLWKIRVSFYGLMRPYIIPKRLAKKSMCVHSINYRTTFHQGTEQKKKYNYNAKMQINTTVRYHFIFHRLANIKSYNTMYRAMECKSMETWKENMGIILWGQTCIYSMS